MSVRQLVDRITEMGLVEDRILQKIRREIDDPEKNVKPKAILSFLVKKEQITKAQAAKLLQDLDRPKALVHDELAVNVKEEKGYDTDDLTNLNPQANDAAAVQTDATRLDMGDPEVVDVEVEIDEEPIYSPDDLVTDIEEVATEAHPPMPAYGGDPLGLGGDPMAGSLGAEPQKEEEKPTQTLGAFAGKKENRDQWSTKWLYIGFGILGFIFIVLAVLYIAVIGQNIEELQRVAEESFQKGAYQDAISKHEDLLDMSPRHENASQWKVRLVHCMLAAPFESKNFGEVLKVAEEHLPNIYEEERFDLLREDLGLILPTSGLELTKAGKSAKTLDEMKGQLSVSERAQAIVNDDRFLTGSIRRIPSVAKQIDEINDNVRRIQDAIQKENDYDSAKVNIAELTEQSNTDDAYTAYNLLVRRYGDLGAREELRDLMRNVSVKEVELVKPIDVNLVAGTDDVESLVEAKVVVARREGLPITALQGEINPVLADGVLYGVDAGDGTVRWNRFMGYESSYEPVWADSENRDELIVSDQRRHEVLKIKAIDGSLIWRVKIGEPFSAPAVTLGKIIVSTFSGKVIGLESQSGNSFASVQLPQKTRVTPATSARYPLVYQPGEYSNLYVLSLDDLSCREVVYLGHTPGSISATPYEWSGYLLVPVNGPDYCDLQVLRPTKGDGIDPGLGLHRTQTILRVTEGHITTPLHRMGRRTLAVSDTGNMRLLDMNKVDSEESPINVVSEHQFEVRRGDQNYVQAEGTRLWIAGKGVERYRISALGEFKRVPLANPGDFFLGQVKKLDTSLIHVRRRARSAMTSISAVDMQEMRQIWRCDLGAAFAGPPRLIDGQIQVVSSQGDLFNIDDAAIRVGYIDRGVWSADVAENFQFNNSVSLENGNYVCVGPEGRREILLVQKDGSTKLSRLQSPADLPACPIVSMGDSLVVASKKGQVVVVNPENGRLIGTPFQPPKEPAKDTVWRQPAVVGANRMVTGVQDGKVFLLESSSRSLDLVKEIEFEGTLDTGFVAANQTAFAVMTIDTLPYLAAWNTEGDFTESKRVELKANVVGGPWLAGNVIMIANDLGDLVAYSTDLGEEPLWTMSLGNDRVVAEPILNGQSILLTMGSGKLMVVDANSGNVQTTVDVGQPIMHQPLFTSDKVYVGGSDGRLLVVPQSAF